MRKIFYVFFQVSLWLVPLRVRIAFLRLLGWRIGADVRLGWCVIVSDSVAIGDRAFVGNWVVFYDLKCVSIGCGAIIGFGCIFRGRHGDHTLFKRSPQRSSQVTIGAESALASRVYVDCSDSVSIGSFVTIAGRGVEIWTHGIDVAANEQRTSPVVIGDYVYVGTGSTFLAGSVIPSRSVVGAKSLVVKDMGAVGGLYAGVPVRRIKDVSGDFFERSCGVTL